MKWVAGCQKAVGIVGAGAVAVAGSTGISDLPIMASSAIVKAVVAGVTGVTGIEAGVVGVAGITVFRWSDARAAWNFQIHEQGESTRLKILIP